MHAFVVLGLTELMFSFSLEKHRSQIICFNSKAIYGVYFTVTTVSIVFNGRKSFSEMPF